MRTRMSGGVGGGEPRSFPLSRFKRALLSVAAVESLSSAVQWKGTGPGQNSTIVHRAKTAGREIGGRIEQRQITEVYHVVSNNATFVTGGHHRESEGNA